MWHCLPVSDFCWCQNGKDEVKAAKAEVEATKAKLEATQNVLDNERLDLEVVLEAKQRAQDELAAESVHK